MKRAIFFSCIFLYGLFSLLWSDVTIGYIDHPPYHPVVNSYTVTPHIGGLNHFPGVHFYLVKLYHNRDRSFISLQRIKDDSFTFNPSKEWTPYLSWDPVLQTLENSDYWLNESGLVIPSVNDDHLPCMTMEIPCYLSSEIPISDVYYRLSGKNSQDYQNYPQFQLVEYQNQPYRPNTRPYPGIDNPYTHYNHDPKLKPVYDYPPPTPNNTSVNNATAYSHPEPDYNTDNEVAPPPKYPVLSTPALLIGHFGLLNLLIPAARNMPHNYLKYYGKALLLSILIEFLVLIFLYTPLAKIKGINGRLMLTLFITCAAGTAITLTINWWIFPLILKQRLTYLIVTELFAIVGEGFLYAYVFKMPLRKAMFLSAACNLVSYFWGLFLIK